MSLKTNILKLISLISPRWNTRISYRFQQGKRLNLRNPQTLSEKVLWLKLNTYFNNALISQCVDKYAVREYVEKQGCGEILNKLLGVWTNPDDIDFDKLPDKFVLKCTYFYHMNLVVTDKSKLDISEARKTMHKWLRSNDHLIRSEMQYRNTHRRIIAEKFIETEDGLAPIDYKVDCCNGNPEYVMVCYEHTQTQKPKFYYFNLDGNLMRDFTNDGLNAPEDFHFIKPEGWEKMLQYAKKLSKPFPYVRADFYIQQGKVIFGELTFTPAAGVSSYKLQKAELILGNKVKLPK